MLNLPLPKGQALTPPLTVLRRPMAPPTGPVHAIVFSRPDQALHEIYPLLLDAAAAGAGDIVGLLKDWIGADGSFRRALILDPDGLDPLQADFTGPCRMASAAFVHLDPAREDADHRELEGRCGVPCVNPYLGAQRVGDKAALAAVWRTKGLATPECTALGAGFTGNPEAFLRDLEALGGREIILKPVRGTEGRRAVRRSWQDSRQRAALADWCREESRQEAMLLCRARDRVRWKGLPIALRMNVSWNMKQAKAESGYVQVGHDSLAVASRSQGGSIHGLDEVWGDLSIGAGPWAELVHTAESGTRAIAAWLGEDTPALLGMDLLLDVETDTVRPFLLEANARPAGMAHCRALDAREPGAEARVSAGLWQRVAALRPREPAHA